MAATADRLTAAEIYERVESSADDEVDRSSSALAFSGLGAGIAMVVTGLRVAAASRSWVRASGRGSCRRCSTRGFIAVIVGRAQLFTENTLYPVVVAVDCRDRRTFVGMTRLWAIVFATNIVGVFVFTLLAVKAGSLDPKIVDPAEDRSDRDHLDADVHARRRALLAQHRVERRDPVVGAERHDPARRLLRVAGGSNPRGTSSWRLHRRAPQLRTGAPGRDRLVMLGRCAFMSVGTRRLRSVR
ncbi:MAG: formate/nitrite transporter family protein [Gaiellaceae bacterium]|jgi:hypothetical protein